MTLVVFLRGINVGGHRRIRPSILADQLRRFGVVSVGATGTFVVRKPGSRTRFRAALLSKLPFEAEVAMCSARELLRLEKKNPFGRKPTRTDVVRFVSVLAKAGRRPAPLPIALPEKGEWFVRVFAGRRPFVFGESRRDMKTIGYLRRLDELFAAPAITRSWKTMMSITQLLK